MMKLLRALGRDSRGATAIEYGLIASLIVIAMISALSMLAGSSTSLWGNISTKSVAAMTN